MDSGQFDTMVHLAGEQTVPNFLAIRQFPGVQKHLILASTKTKEPANRVLDVAGVRGKVLDVEDPWEAPGIVSVLRSHAPDGTRCAYNVTGGTKLMAIASLHHALETGARAFYVHTEGAAIQWVGEDWGREPLQGSLEVEDFIRLAGHDLIDPGYWEDVPEREGRADVTRTLWKFRRCLAKAYKDVVNAMDTGGTLERTYKRKQRAVTIEWARGTGRLVCEKQGKPVVDEQVEWPDFLQYMAGGWFEEYCYLMLRPCLEDGEVQDIRIGLRPSWNMDVEDDADEASKQEFDIVLTDGLRLTIVECKSGWSVRQQHIQKLENNVSSYAGVMGRGILAAALKIDSHQAKPNRERISQSRCLAAFGGKAVEKRMPDRILDVRPGQVFPGNS